MNRGQTVPKIFFSAVNSLQKQTCSRPPTLAVKTMLCMVWPEQEHLSPLTTSQLHHTPEPDSHTNYLWVPDTPVQDWGSRTGPKCWKFHSSCETNWNAKGHSVSQFCSRMIAFQQQKNFHGKSHEIRCPLALFGLVLLDIDTHKALLLENLTNTLKVICFHYLGRTSWGHLGFSLKTACCSAAVKTANRLWGVVSKRTENKPGNVVILMQHILGVLRINVRWQVLAYLSKETYHFMPRDCFLFQIPVSLKCESPFGKQSSWHSLFFGVSCQSLKCHSTEFCWSLTEFTHLW